MYFFCLFLIIVLAYWQIAFLHSSLRWDLIDVVFPFRYHFSECIQSGSFPFWDPYQQTGVPFYADLQAPSYYPELLFVSLISGYGIYTMHILFIFYVFISAIGIYKLSFYLNKNHLASFFAGIVYALSGFTVAHGQHFFLLVGAAWIPFVILYYLRLNENRQLTDVFKCAVALFLMLSGGYQALSIFLLYFLLILFLYSIGKEVRIKNFKNVFSILKYNAWLAFVIILLCLPLLISTFEVLSSVERLESGVNIQKALAGGLSVNSFLSFILPFSTVKNPEFFGIDISVRNVYFGIIPLIFFLLALTKKRSILEYLFLLFGLVAFTSAMGDHLPVREFMFKHVPLMNLYHTTPYVSILGLLVFVIIAANFFAELQENENKRKRGVILFTAAVLLVLGSIFVFSCTKVDFSNLPFLKRHTDLLNGTTFYEHLLFQSSVQLFLGAAFLFLILFYKKIKYPAFLILTIVSIDMVVSTQMNILYTTADKDYKPARMNKDLSLYPNKFPIPVDNKLIYNDQHTLVPPFWRNTYIFRKQIGFNSFSSFELKNYSKLDNDYPNLRDAVLNNQLVYFSDQIFPLSQFNDSLIDPELHSNYLFFSDSIYNQLNGNIVSANTSDSARITGFGPNKVRIETRTAANQYLTIIQSNYNGWAAFVDDVKVPIYSSNFNYKTILLPKGKHTVHFRFRNNAVLWTYVFSILFFVGILMFFVASLLLKKTNSRFISISIALVVFSVLLILLLIRLNTKRETETTHRQIDKRWNNVPSAIHIDEDFESAENNLTYDSLTVYSGKRSLVIDSITDYLPAMEIVFDKEKIKRGTLRFSANVYPKTLSSALIVTQLSRDGEQIDWFGEKLETQIERTNAWNKIEYLKNYYDLQPNDKLRIYIWNNGKMSMNIDDIKIDFYTF